MRAFLHFDLVRLFAEDYKRSNASTRGIPYATTFDLNNKPLLTLHETFKAILKDLDMAESLLADDNEVSVERTPTSDYLKGRATFFSKYAVAATKARVYYAMGDTANAAKYARLVIAATSNFSLKKLTSMADVKRFPATGELIFGLYNNTLSADISFNVPFANGARNIHRRSPRLGRTLRNVGFLGHKCRPSLYGILSTEHHPPTE